MAITVEYHGGPLDGQWEDLPDYTFTRSVESIEILDYETYDTRITRYTYEMRAVERMMLCNYGRKFPRTRFWLEKTESIE